MSSKSKKLSAVANIFEQTIDGAIRKIPIDQISPSHDQPRKNKDINIEFLAASLQEEGLLQPIVVTKEDSAYVIVAGERRYRAAKSLNWKEIECRIIKKIPKEKFKVAVIENLQRENLSPVEESFAYKKLKNLFSYTDKELSDIVGKSRNYISEILSIAELSENWLKKADESGIFSRNLLIQYAHAVKLGQGDIFISNFHEGNISTVKTAKEFIKNQKSMPTTEKELIVNNHNLPTNKKQLQSLFNISISSNWVGSNKASIQMQISDINSSIISLESLEKKINNTVEQFLSGFSS